MYKFTSGTEKIGFILITLYQFEISRKIWRAQNKNRGPQYKTHVGLNTKFDPNTPWADTMMEP